MFRCNKLFHYPLVTGARAQYPAGALALIGMLILLSSPAPAQEHWQDGGKVNRRAGSAPGGDEESLLFREGRDLIEEEAWGDAASKFSEFVRKYPRARNADAALYWLAFSLKKVGKYNEADQRLAELIDKYSGSRWGNDARAMRIEISSLVSSKQPLENIDAYDEETKIVVLLELLRRDPGRGIALARDVLTGKAKGSRSFKENVVTILGQHQSKAASALLVEVARQDSDPKLRKAAVHSLGPVADKNGLDLLKEIAMSGADGELGQSAIFAISRSALPEASLALSDLARRSDAPDVCSTAVFWLGERSDEQSLDELIKLVDSSDRLSVQSAAVFALSRNRNPRARAKLLDILRTATSTTLRGQAAFWLAQPGDEQSLNELIKLYDEEKNVAVKSNLIGALYKMNMKRALRKLIDIARSDASTELRKQAIFWLGQSSDPEAKKFIEELLR